MKSNISKHPCANKCTDFKEEQCTTCLVPENAQIAVSKTVNQKFIKGDVVAYMNHIEFDDLRTVEAYQPVDHYWLDNGQLVYESWIRTATVAELDANRRLSEPELAMAEVS
ncbi:hypothetical protein [Acinetobacter gerneri]|uniref:hypothetical protein n=1 Tax=Acinetobacter gerneri TaxID=202952 RepID=UPI0023F4AD1B|nr:hypothetical protein [Acinetobacter gerneri]MCH4245963.1 hypothetical protein [Acinetobacter gerneri]